MPFPQEIEALLQKHGSGASGDETAGITDQERTQLLKPVLETCEEEWASKSETLDLIAQKLGDGSRDAAWRVPYGESGILGFFLRVLDTSGLRQALQVHSLRLVGNSCADTDENRARLVEGKRLEAVIKHLSDGKLIPFTIPVLYNILVDYEPAQLLASQSRLSSHLITLLSCINLDQYAPYITYFCKILALLVTQEGEPAVTDPSTVPVLLKLAAKVDLPHDVDDFASLVSVAAAYLGSDEAQDKFAEAPEVDLFFSAYERLYTEIDIEEVDDEDTAAQVKQLRASLLGVLAGITGNDSFFIRHPFASPTTEKLWAWLDNCAQPNSHLQAAACLALGNLARSDEQCIKLVHTHKVHLRLMEILSDPKVQDTQLLHSALSFLKNLAIPTVNKPVLGDLLEPKCVPRIYTLDTVPQVQYAAVSLTRLLLVNCPSNVRRLCALRNVEQSNGDQEEGTSVTGIISLFGRSDAEPTRLEAARSLAVVCRALHSNTPSEILPDWKPSESNGSTSSIEVQDEESGRRQIFYKKHSLIEPLAFLVTQPKWPIIRSEAWFVFALMSRSQDGASLVTSVLGDQSALDALTAAVTGQDKEQAASHQIESASSAETDLAAMAGGLNLEPQQVDPSKKANMIKVDRENAVVLCTELLRIKEGLSQELQSTLQGLVKEGTEAIAAERVGLTTE